MTEAGEPASYGKTTSFPDCNQHGDFTGDKFCLGRSAPKATPQAVPAFPGTLVNARYVYVTSYDGDQFNTNLFPDDRQAIATVQDALQKWGKFTLVYQANQADIVLMVTSRPSEDIPRSMTRTAGRATSICGA